MPTTTTYKRGSVVLVSFIFTDETGAKKRPAVVVSSDKYHKDRQEVIIAAITSRTDRILAGDLLIRDWSEAGLKSPSVATGIIRTIKHDMIVQKLGTLSKCDLSEIDKNLYVILGIK